MRVNKVFAMRTAVVGSAAAGHTLLGMRAAIVALALVAAAPAWAQVRQYDYSGLRRDEQRREEERLQRERIEDLRRQDQTRQYFNSERQRLDSYGAQIDVERRRLDAERQQLEAERRRLGQ